MESARRSTRSEERPHIYSVFMRNVGSANQSELKERLESMRRLRSDEAENGYHLTEFVNKLRGLIKEVMSLITNVNGNSSWREAVDKLKIINMQLKVKTGVAEFLNDVHFEILGMLRGVFSLDPSFTSIYSAGLEILETITFQFTTSELSSQAYVFSMDFLNVVSQLHDPSVVLTYSYYLNNIFGNCLLGIEDITSIDVSKVAEYFSTVLGIVRLKKSSDYCKSSLRYIRSVFLRFSQFNPRNQVFSSQHGFYASAQVALGGFKIDEVFLYSLNYIDKEGEMQIDLLQEILWTAAFTVKHFPSLQGTYNESLFKSLTNYILSSDASLSRVELALPYLSYCSGYLLQSSPEALESLMGNAGLSILNRLTAILEWQNCSPNVKREALLCIYNYICKGVSLETVEVIAKVLSSIDVSTTERGLVKEVVFILLNFIERCICGGQRHSETFKKSSDLCKAALSKLQYSPEELEYLTKNYDDALTELRNRPEPALRCLFN